MLLIDLLISLWRVFSNSIKTFFVLPYFMREFAVVLKVCPALMYWRSDRTRRSQSDTQQGLYLPMLKS